MQVDQRSLSLKVGLFCTALRHRYVPPIDTTKHLHSRSFYLAWCHAEKQLLLHVLNARSAGDVREDIFEDIIIDIDRPMCRDCQAFFREVVVAAETSRVNIIRVQDPEKCWHFKGR